MIVVKRDGREVPYDANKVVNAIHAAVDAVGGTDMERGYYLGDIVNLKIQNSNRDKWTVEEIQDIVEKTLIEQGHATTAKAYILYRQRRSDVRYMKSMEQKIIHDFLFIDAADMDEKRENANIDGGATMGIMLSIGSAMTNSFYMKMLVRPEYKLMHDEGRVHSHDNNFACLTVNCLEIPLRKLLDKGFSTGHGFLRTPSTIQSASSLTCISIQANQNDMLGGQAIPMLDYDLAPYVAKSFVRNLGLYFSTRDCLTFDHYNNIDRYKEVFLPAFDKWIMEHRGIMNTAGIRMLDAALSFIRYDIRGKAYSWAEKKTRRDTDQAMEALVHNLCTMGSRAGSQVPFSSVNFGTDTSEEGRMVIKSILKATEDGLGNHETAIFPIAIFKMLKGVNRNPGDPNYDLFQYACRVSAKRLAPNYVNLNATFNHKYYKGTPETEVSSMGATATGYVLIRHRAESDEFIEKMIAISALGAYLWQHALCTEYKHFDEHTVYVEVVPGTVGIYDGKSGRFVELKKWMMFTNAEQWYLFATHAKCDTYWFTADHPLSIHRDEKIQRILVQDINADTDQILKGTDECGWYLDYIKVCQPVNVKLVGYDVETSSDTFTLYNTDDKHSPCIVSHNCRTRVIGNVHDPDREITPGRGNLFPITINLPWIALEAREELSGSPTGECDQDQLIDLFFIKAHEILEHVFQMLLDRFDVVSKRKAKCFPMLMGQHLYLDSDNLGPDDTIEKPMKHGTLTAGFIGLAETLVSLIGKHHGESEEAQALGLKIIKFMNDLCTKKAQETKLNFSFMGSPAEGCTGRLMKCLKKRFGTIPGVTEREYLTNSSHVPVWFNISIYDKVKIEAPYHEYEPAGHILYAEIDDDVTHNPEAVQQIIEFMADNNAGYFAINHPVDRDPVCGYLGKIGDRCPRCGRREGEGVPAGKLLELSSYQPDPQYAVRYTDLEDGDVVPNSYEPSNPKGSTDHV